MAVLNIDLDLRRLGSADRLNHRFNALAFLFRIVCHFLSVGAIGGCNLFYGLKPLDLLESFRFLKPKAVV
jgi:hypothetical protein